MVWVGGSAAAGDGNGGEMHWVMERFVFMMGDWKISYIPRCCVPNVLFGLMYGRDWPEVIAE